jgi:hypothetical protein
MGIFPRGTLKEVHKMTTYNPDTEYLILYTHCPPQVLTYYDFSITELLEMRTISGALMLEVYNAEPTEEETAARNLERIARRNSGLTGARE